MVEAPFWVLAQRRDITAQSRGSQRWARHKDREKTGVQATLVNEPEGVTGLDYDSGSRYIKGGRIKSNTMCSQGWSPNDLSQNHQRNCLTSDLLICEIMAHVYNALPRWWLYTQKSVPWLPMEYRKRKTMEVEVDCKILRQLWVWKNVSQSSSNKYWVKQNGFKLGHVQ